MGTVIGQIVPDYFFIFQIVALNHLQSPTTAMGRILDVPRAKDTFPERIFAKVRKVPCL